jgi:hypothetical protein
LRIVEAFKVGGRMDGFQQCSHVLPSPGGNQIRPGIQGKVTGSKAPLKWGLWFREKNPGIACVKYTCAAKRGFDGLDGGIAMGFGARAPQR